MGICNEKIFSQIYNKYIQDLINFLQYRFGSLYNPEDKAQEAFIKLWENCSDVSEDKAKSFLFTVGNNMMLNEVKHQKVVLKHQTMSSDKSNNENPEFILEHQQFLEKYQRALENLSEVQRVAFLLNRADGKSHSEVAEILGITLRAARKRIYSAVENLRKDIDLI